MIAYRPLFEVSVVMLIATTFRTAFGFGEALIAVPLLSLLLPVRLSAPVVVLASVVIALVAVIHDWRHIHFGSVRRLLLATVFGLPFGLLILRYAPEGATKAILGVLLLLFSAFSMIKPDLFILKSDRLAWLFGFLAGVTGGSYGMNGPPLAIYGASRRWSPQQFRATIQAYFLPASILGMVGYSISGLWTKEVNVVFLSSLPAVAAGVFAGRLLGKIADKGRFTLFLYTSLILVACVLLFQAFTKWRS